MSAKVGRGGSNAAKQAFTNQLFYNAFEQRQVYNSIVLLFSFDLKDFYYYQVFIGFTFYVINLLWYLFALISHNIL